MPKALIIDKDPLISSLIEFMIAHSGIVDVMSFADPAQAVRCTKGCRDVGCIVYNCDSIVDATVDEVVDTIREEHPNAKVLLLSEKNGSAVMRTRKYSTAGLGDRFFTLTLKRFIRSVLPPDSIE